MKAKQTYARQEGKEIVLGSRNGPRKTRKQQRTKWGMVSRVLAEVAGEESGKVGWG